MPVALFIGGVLPDLAQDKALRVFLLDGLSQVLQKLVGQLVGYVEPPAAVACLHPFADDAVFSIDVLVELRVGFVDLRQGVEAPPGVVLVRPLAEVVPARIRGLLRIVGA